jgi:chromosome segregation ATPase
MTEDQDLRDNLEAKLSACRAHTSTLSMKLSVFEAAKEKAESEREAAVAEKLKSEELSESRYKTLRRKYNHYKNKSKHLMRQLAFVPKLLNP